MKECISVINQKGGVGKSTTASTLGAGLYHRGYKVLYIDLDAQGNLSYSMNATGRAITSLEVLTGTAKAEDAITHTQQGDLIPASPALAGADTILTEMGKEYRLKEALENIAPAYDYIIIDTPPALGTLTINALTACNSAVIPAQAEAYSLQGIGQLSQTIQAVKKYCNSGLYIKGILITRYNGRAILSRDMGDLLDATAQQLNTKLFNTRIREGIAVKEAQASKQDIFTYNAKSNPALDYMAFIEELLNE